jgi:hypothetical protein
VGFGVITTVIMKNVLGCGTVWTSRRLISTGLHCVTSYINVLFTIIVKNLPALFHQPAHEPFNLFIHLIIELIIFVIRTVGVGVQTGSTRHVGHFWPIVSAPGDSENGEFGGMKIGRGNRSTRRKPTPAPICLPQIPLDQTLARTRAVRWEASD